MFTDKEIQARIIAYFEKKKYAHTAMVARACKCHYNDVGIAMAQIEALRGPSFTPIAKILNLKMNMRLTYYAMDAEWALKKGKSITASNKLLQKKWLRMQVMEQLNGHSDRWVRRAIKLVENMKEPLSLHPKYFLLSKVEVVEIYKSILDAIPQS